MSDHAAQVSIGWTTAPSREIAEQIAHTLVGSGLVACGQITGPVTSIYRWQGELQQEEEFRLILKFSAQREAEVRAALQIAHPYDVPQWVVTHADTGHEAYMTWVHDSAREDRP
ncbi:MAG: divalent-cation tolerance protein CutA [Puniceicoccales bacterium]